MWSILDPGVWTRLASVVGIGRGADLILYGLVVAFFGFVVTTFKRFREMEIRYTRLARRIAIDEAAPATRRPAVTAAATPADAATATDDGEAAGDAPAPESGAPHDAA